MFESQPYVPAPGTTAQPAACPGVLERLGLWPAPVPYVSPPAPPAPMPPPTTVPALAPAQLGGAGSTILPRQVMVVDVEVLAPEIRASKERASRIVAARSVCVSVPQGATRYRVSFSPVSPAMPCGSDSPPNALPFGIEEPATGEVPPGVTTIHVTPTWVRLSEEPVHANSVRAVLSVEFT